MRLLVTECAGFTGCNVSELFVKEGHSVVGIDTLNDGFDVRLTEWRLSQLKGKVRVYWEEALFQLQLQG